MYEEHLYVKVNKEQEEELRLRRSHPYIGKYCVRVSKVLIREFALVLSDRLNRMVYEREGVADRFGAERYQKTGARYVVVRKVLSGDLLSAVEKELLL